MNRQERAKQFAPFDALKGLKDALRQKEFEHEKLQKRELSDEEIEGLQAALVKLQKGDLVEITCYENGYYIVVKGEVVKKDITSKYITIGEGKISFGDIYKIIFV